MNFTPPQHQTVRAAFLGDDGGALLRYMHLKSLRHDTGELEAQCGDRVRELGWIGGDGRLTAHGQCVADSCREYFFWLERDRRLPFETPGSSLAIEHFADRKVLEIGCGMGANLMALRSVTDRLVGIEPCEIYTQMGGIFRERDNLPALEIEICSAEDIVLEDTDFDTVLCVTAHQYLDIAPAFREIARLLKPGGELLIIGGTFGTYFLSPSVSEGLKADTITLANTLSYMAARKRILPARAGTFTARPIYPPVAFLRRWLSQAGLVPDPGPYPRLGTERYLRAVKS